MIAREPIFSALFAKLSALTEFTTTSRRLQSIQDIAIENFPAAYQLQGKQVVHKKVNVPPIYEMEASWILCAFESDQTIAPSTQLNALIDDAVGALEPDATTNANTLGGLVTQCTIEGDIEVFEGVLGDRAVAIIPIRILVPGF
ncbi:MAG: hypothetical protein ACRESO_04095 [Gammaproteobacteria bacterium]